MCFWAIGFISFTFIILPFTLLLLLIYAQRSWTAIDMTEVNSDRLHAASTSSPSSSHSKKPAPIPASASSTVIGTVLAVAGGGGKSLTSVPFVKDTLTFECRQTNRLREMERRIESEMRRKKRDWEREVEHMRLVDGAATIWLMDTAMEWELFKWCRSVFVNIKQSKSSQIIAVNFDVCLITLPLEIHYTCIMYRPLYQKL